MDKSISHYNLGRSCLLAIAAFGAVNTLMALAGLGTYFLFSNFLAYISAIFFRAGYEETGEGLFLVIGAVAAVLILGLFLLCWLLSKKHRGWLVVGLVLMIIDTLVVVYCAFALFSPVEMALDIIFHIVMIVELVLGVSASKKALAEPEPQEAAEPWEQQPAEKPVPEIAEESDAAND